MLKPVVGRIPGARRLASLLGLRSQRTNHRAFLLELLPKNAIVAEIGVHRGDFSAQILEITNPMELHLVDPWIHEESATYKYALYGGAVKGGQTEMNDRYEATCSRFELDIRVGRVRIHRGYSNDVLNDFPEEYFDWVYIDGNHLFEYVKQDLELAFRKTKLDGYITGDDYTEGGWWRGGVKRAVDEFFQEKPIQSLTVRNRQFVLRK
jgi:hypothetical protein